MTSVNSEKTLEYVKIQENLRSENLRKKNIFIYAYKHKVRQITEL